MSWPLRALWALRGLRKPSGRRRRNENSAAGGAKFCGKLFSRNPEVKSDSTGNFHLLFAPPARALGAAPAPLVLLRCSGSHLRRLPSQSSKPFGAFAALRRRRSSTPARETGASGGLRIGRACFPSRLRQPPVASASVTASALRSAAGFASPGGLAPVLREPPNGVSLRGSRHCYAMCGTSYASPSGADLLRLRTCSAAPGVCTLRLRLRVSLPSHASEPPAVSPRVEAKPPCGFAFNVCSRRTSINDRRFKISEFFDSQIEVRMIGVRYSRAACRPSPSARDGSGYAAKGHADGFPPGGG